MKYMRFNSKRIYTVTNANQLLSYWCPTKCTNYHSTTAFDAVQCWISTVL